MSAMTGLSRRSGGAGRDAGVASRRTNNNRRRPDDASRASVRLLSEEEEEDAATSETQEKETHTHSKDATTTTTNRVTQSPRVLPSQRRYSNGNSRDQGPDEEDGEDDEKTTATANENENGNENAKETAAYLRSPVQEISVPRRSSSRSQQQQQQQHTLAPSSPPPSDKRLRKAPSYLDESTLQRLQQTLQDDSITNAYLNDDELTSFMIRMNRTAQRQTEEQHHHHHHHHHHSSSHNNNNNSNNNSQSSDDDNYSESSLFLDVLAEEEELAVGQAFFRDVLAHLKHTEEKDEEEDHDTHTDNKHNNNKAAAVENTLDMRTLTWVRRAAGLHRSKHSETTHHHHHQHASLFQQRRHSLVKTRMATRRQKVQQRHKDVQVLVDALKDVEAAMGAPFPKVNITMKRKRDEQATSLSSPEQPATKKGSSSNRHTAANSNHNNNIPRLTRTLLARVAAKHVLSNGLSFLIPKHVFVKRIIVNGATFDIHRPEKGRSTANRVQQDQLQAHPDLLSQLLTPEATPFDFNLKRAHWQRHLKLSYTRTAFNRPEVKEYYAKAVANKIPRKVKAKQIQFRLPRWETLNKSKDVAPVPLDPPRQRYSDDVYAAFCIKMLQSLNGSARSWALKEFFYSDIDREWYNRNEMVEEAIKMGLPPDIRLTRVEWKVIRQRVWAKQRPRRFTNGFIDSQLKQLRDHRVRVRQLQRSPEMASAFTIDHNIPAVTHVGKTVTAYSTRYDIIQRGRVLCYEPLACAYRILFDRKEFGSELCLDHNVATHGGSTILIPRSQPMACGPSLFNCGTAKGYMIDTFRAPKVALEPELYKALIFDPHPTPAPVATLPKRKEAIKDARLEAIRQVAENDTLVGLLNVIDVATRRKESLLEALGEANKVFAASSSGVSEQFMYSCEWIKASLAQTNSILNAALPKLRLMYGKLYLPSPSSVSHNPENSNHRAKFLEKGLDIILDDQRPSSHLGNEWATKLTTDASKLSETIASVVMERAAELPEEDSQFTEERMKPVGRLLLTTSYGHRFSRVSNVANHIPLASSLVVASQVLLDFPSLPDVLDADDLYAQVKSSRDAAAEDLKEALAQLHTEVILAAAKKSLDQPAETGT